MIYEINGINRKHVFNYFSRKQMDKKKKTPKELGYYFPAEFTPHLATWLSWPHKEASWPGKIHTIYPYYCQFIKELTQHQCTDRSANVAFFATFSPRRASPADRNGCRSMRPATKESFSGARCAILAACRPSCFSDPAIQRGEPGTVGIRQITTRSRQLPMSAFRQSLFSG